MRAVKTFPGDDTSKSPYLTAFIAYKAGMTHVVREVDRAGSKLHKKDACDAATVVEAPPMIVVGMTGYVRTARGLRCLNTIWAEHLDDQAKRNFYKNWYKSKRKAFSKYAQNYTNGTKSIDSELEQLKKHSDVLRIIAHTQVRRISNLGKKKADMMEIQVNGGSTMDEKVDFAYSLFEKDVPVDAVFSEAECLDTIGVTKGKGNEGVVGRWGVTRLPRKTHRGLRKVACVGAWHPANMQYTVARSGQDGYHHRTELNKKIMKLGKSGEQSFKVTTDHDLTDKSITPMGGFPQYGIIRSDYLLLKGCIVGPRKRVITLRRNLHPPTGRIAQEDPNIKFVDTAAKNGSAGRYQTRAEVRRLMQSS